MDGVTAVTSGVGGAVSNNPQAQALSGTLSSNMGIVLSIASFGILMVILYRVFDTRLIGG